MKKCIQEASLCSSKTMAEMWASSSMEATLWSRDLVLSHTITLHRPWKFWRALLLECSRISTRLKKSCLEFQTKREWLTKPSRLHSLRRTIQWFTTWRGIIVTLLWWVAISLWAASISHELSATTQFAVLCGQNYFKQFSNFHKMLSMAMQLDLTRAYLTSKIKKKSAWLSKTTSS